jgi:hypothetical protein
MTAAPSHTGRIVVDGRVEHRTHEGLLVVVRAGCFQRNVIVPPIEGVDVGDEVVVELEHDLKHGTIQQPPALPRFRPTPRRR